MIDLTIRDAVIHDGTGAPETRGDIGIDGGRIVAVGACDESSRRTIDAAGRIVCPGFVDVHTHYDAQALWDPTLSPSPLHGVTSVIAGNCGFSIAPLSSDSSDYLKRMLARVEGMPLSALVEGPAWDWTTTAGYLDRIDGTLAVNAGFHVGHSTIRRVVMGPDDERVPTDDELRAMQSLLREGLSAGAIGFSSSWSPSHLDDASEPVPSLKAKGDELVALAAVCREFPGTSIEFIANFPGDAYTDEERDLLVRISTTARRPVNWNILTVNSSIEFAEAKLSVGDAARAAGGKVVGLVNPKPIVSRMNFMSAFMLDCIPGWREAMALPPRQRLALLRVPAERERLERAARSPEAAGYAEFCTMWDRYMIYESASAETKRYEGRRVADIAAEEGKTPFDALLDIVCQDELLTSYGGVPAESTAEDWTRRARIWRNPNAVLGGSDAGAHLDLLGAFDYTTFLLGDVMRAAAPLAMHELIAMLTSVPADLFGLHDRGRLVPGAHADVVVFDPDTVGTQPLSTRFDCPGGAGRLYAESTGIGHVLVAGTEIIVDGHFTEQRPGRVLRSGRDTVTPSLL